MAGIVNRSRKIFLRRPLDYRGPRTEKHQVNVQRLLPNKRRILGWVSFFMNSTKRMRANDEPLQKVFPGWANHAPKDARLNLRREEGAGGGGIPEGLPAEEGAGRSVLRHPALRFP